MIKDQKLNFNFDVGKPKQKNNIVIFFLSSKEKMKDELLTFPYAMKNNLAEVQEVNEKGAIGNCSECGAQGSELYLYSSK